MTDTSQNLAPLSGLKSFFGRFALGLALVAGAGIVGAVNGDAPSVIMIKAFIGVLFATAAFSVPKLFDQEQSQRPFTSSFLGRRALGATCLAIYITSFSWSPEVQIVHSAVIFAATALVMFAGDMTIAWFERHRL